MWLLCTKLINGHVLLYSDLIAACAALTISPWIVLLFLFQFAAPLLRPLAATLPDAGFRKVLAARLTVQDVALRLIADHRRVLAQVAALEGFVRCQYRGM